MVVVLEDEHNTTKTCPGRKADGQPCGHEYKPKGRIYRCPACGFVSQRDAVGASNLLSRHLYGDVGQVVPPLLIKYRHPFVTGKRSRLDTADLAWGPTTREA